MKPRLTCTRMMGREKYGEQKERLMIQNTPSIRCDTVHWHVGLPVELGRNSTINCEMFRAVLCSNSAKCCKTGWKEQTDNDLTTKEIQEFLSIQEIFFNSQVSPLILTQQFYLYAFYLLNQKHNGEKLTNVQ